MIEKMTDYCEVNFDGLVGPTHNYGGLSVGNVASMSHGGKTSNPQAAALQGLQKMRFLLDKGLTQAVLPPHARPDVASLHQLGFAGSDTQIVNKAGSNPALLANIMSASAMWTANAATVSPGPDTQDGHLHLTAANLNSTFHRSIECQQTSRILRRIFENDSHFCVHEPVLQHPCFGDEGAANHGRLCDGHGKQGVELFVFGRQAFEKSTSQFPRRQALEASQAVAKKHQLASNSTLFLRQSAAAIDAGAFHNDVVSVCNEQVFLLHEKTFEDQSGSLEQISAACEFDPCYLEISEEEVPLTDVISSYLFNGQLLTMPDGTMALLVPQDVQDNPRTLACVNRLKSEDNPIQQVFFMNLRESMHNGGGPACLRLRVAMSQKQIAALSGAVVLDNHKIDQLEALVRQYYRTELSPGDLADPDFVTDSFTALDAIAQCLELGAIYDFQM